MQAKQIGRQALGQTAIGCPLKRRPEAGMLPGMEPSRSANGPFASKKPQSILPSATATVPLVWVWHTEQVTHVAQTMLQGHSARRARDARHGGRSLSGRYEIRSALAFGVLREHGFRQEGGMECSTT